jgi:hypothetical protein
VPSALRALCILIDSKCGSKFMNLRIFGLKTGSRFFVKMLYIGAVQTVAGSNSVSAMRGGTGTWRAWLLAGMAVGGHGCERGASPAISERRSRALRILMDSKCGSRFMIFRITGRKTGIQFSGKCLSYDSRTLFW